MNLPAVIEQPEFGYSISYDIDFASPSYRELINSYVDEVSVSDWISCLNETALRQQKEEFERKDIFSRTNGTSTDARKLQKYLTSNLPETNLPNNNRFYIFIFNFSRLDYGKQHWLNVSEVDIDSGQSRFWWRLEWDYPLNFETKFPYAAYTEVSNIAILDPTAFQWYLTWRMIWNKNVGVHYTYDSTLTELLYSRSTVTEKIELVVDTLSTWINDWLSHIFNIYTFPLPLGTSVDIQLLAIYDSHQKKQSELEWIINNKIIEDITNFILHSDNLQVSTTYVERQQDTVISNYLANQEVNYASFQSSISPFENWTYFDGRSIILDTNNASSPLRKEYFHTSDREITIHGTILILDNASYVEHEDIIPWAGGLYIGLGGNRTVSMLWELDRAFMPDGTTHKAGLSKIIIHEIGHAKGFPHTFSNTFTSDFANDVMGYYPAIVNYSQIVSSIYFRTAADTLLRTVVEFYPNYYSNLINDDEQKLFDFSKDFESAVNLQKTKQYYRAWQILKNLNADLTAEIQVNNSTSKKSILYPFYPGLVIVVVSFYRKRQKNFFDKNGSW